MFGSVGMRRALLAALVLGTASSASAADDGIWSVSKASGDVWIATEGVQQTSLKQDETLKPGDTIRTGRNGRVLLVRGEETIMIAPNSVVGVPAEKKDGLSTTILQQAGSILLEVEKRNVKHFEVETPYLAAVVKGTRFSVTVNAGSTRVGVLRGQVEVSDFRTGQIAQVMPGQAATAFEHGKPGLSLSGSGSFNPIEQGKPRASSIEPIRVPKSGLSAPRDASNGRAFHALNRVDKAAGGSTSRPSAVRISGALGEVKVNFHKVTHGLARGSSVPPGAVRNASNANADTVWSDTRASTTTTTTNSNTAGQTAAALSVGATSAASSSGAVAAAVAGSSSDYAGNSGNGNGNGNGNGQGNGNSGATGNGKGNNGNGNGNGGGNGSNGQGNAYGRSKH
ncbi:FecR family protein [Bradyrhizobium sp.]|uniref:FecR family protein n=1 Tax=Bradyrhizobium sp. TaxID=376 RepID=UPI00239FADA3|nr:FecR family protein [Bradyrhizobium sp.]MDE2377376.1 FecR domain-containing protein [Bradyrhizobium sp.]